MVRLVSFVTATALSAAALVAGPTAALAQTAQRPTTSDGAVRMATYNICKKSCGKGRFSQVHL